MNLSSSVCLPGWSCHVKNSCTSCTWASMRFLLYRFLSFTAHSSRFSCCVSLHSTSETVFLQSNSSFSLTSTSFTFCWTCEQSRQEWKNILKKHTHTHLPASLNDKGAQLPSALSCWSHWCSGHALFPAAGWSFVVSALLVGVQWSHAPGFFCPVQGALRDFAASPLIGWIWPGSMCNIVILHKYLIFVKRQIPITSYVYSKPVRKIYIMGKKCRKEKLWNWRFII